MRLIDASICVVESCESRLQFVNLRLQRLSIILELVKFQYLASEPLGDAIALAGAPGVGAGLFEVGRHWPVSACVMVLHSKKREYYKQKSFAEWGKSQAVEVKAAQEPHPPFS